MFDIGFFELLVIAVVGLLVIGPERLPHAMRAGALWWGRLKRSMRETRAELEKQIGADEIRRELHNEEVMRSLDALRATRDDLERQIRDADAPDPGTEPDTTAQNTPEAQATTEQQAAIPNADTGDASNTSDKHTGKPND